jgi:hypothetical protein
VHRIVDWNMSAYVLEWNLKEQGAQNLTPKGILHARELTLGCWDFLAALASETLDGRAVLWWSQITSAFQALGVYTRA